MKENLTKEQILMALHSLETLIRSMKGPGRCTTCLNFSSESGFCNTHNRNVPQEYLDSGCTSWDGIPF